MSEQVICVQNYYRGTGDVRDQVFKKGQVYSADFGRFTLKVDGREITYEVYDRIFMSYERYQLLQEVEYMINEIADMVDDLEQKAITAKDFAELFKNHKSAQLVQVLSNSRKALKKGE